MGLTLDYSKQEYADSLGNREFKPLTPGNYPAKMEKFEEGIAKSSGDPKVTVYYRIDANAAEGKNRVIIKDYSLAPHAIWSWNNAMIALGGVDSAFFEGNKKVNVEAVCQSNVGQPCVLELTPPDDGYNNNNVKQVKPRI